MFGGGSTRHHLAFPGKIRAGFAGHGVRRAGQRLMHQPPNLPDWTRHFVYRTELTRTTWKLRIGLVVLFVVAAWFTRGWWTASIGRSLVCEANGAPSDAILIEKSQHH